MKFSPSPFEKCGLVPAGRFRRRVNYTTRREKGKHVKKKRKKKEKREREKKRSSRATHIKRELNVEISVSQRRKRDGDGGPALRFSPPLHWVFHPVEPCIYLYTDSSLVYKNSTPAFKRALKPGFERVTVPRNYITCPIYLSTYFSELGKEGTIGVEDFHPKNSLFFRERRRRRRRAINIRIEFVNSPLNFSNLFRGNNLASCSTKNQKNALPSHGEPLRNAINVAFLRVCAGIGSNGSARYSSAFASRIRDDNACFEQFRGDNTRNVDSEIGQQGRGIRLRRISRIQRGEIRFERSKYSFEKRNLEFPLIDIG